MVTRIRQHNGIAARNFIHEQAQSRMKEIVSAAQQISHNSVFVHATPIIYFAKQEGGTLCGCREKSKDNGVAPIENAGETNVDFDIHVERPMFGGLSSMLSKSEKSKVAKENYDDDLEDIFGEGDSENFDNANQGQEVFDSIFGNSVACPICFRSGIVPGYIPVGYSRQVFSSVFVEDAYGYYINTAKPVPLFEVTDQNSNYVAFRLHVPKFFKEVKFAAYEGQNIIKNVILSIGGYAITEGLLRNFAGKEVILHVSGADFTHCVFMFKINDDLKADFPQDSKPKDYSIFDATQPVTIVTDKSIPKLSTSDIIYKVGYNQFWKVNDFEYYRMNDKTVIGWSIQARILQKDELGHLLMSF